MKFFLEVSNKFRSLPWLSCQAVHNYVMSSCIIKTWPWLKTAPSKTTSDQRSWSWLKRNWDGLTLNIFGLPVDGRAASLLGKQSCNIKHRLLCLLLSAVDWDVLPRVGVPPLWHHSGPEQETIKGGGAVYRIHQWKIFICIYTLATLEGEAFPF